MIEEAPFAPTHTFHSCILHKSHSPPHLSLKYSMTFTEGLPCNHSNHSTFVNPLCQFISHFSEWPNHLEVKHPATASFTFKKKNLIFIHTFTAFTVHPIQTTNTSLTTHPHCLVQYTILLHSVSMSLLHISVLALYGVMQCLLHIYCPTLIHMSQRSCYFSPL